MTQRFGQSLRTRPSAALVALLVGLSSPSALAYNFANSCDGPDKKDSGPLNETLHTRGMPLGSPQANAYFNTINNWNAYSNLTVSAFATDAGGFIVGGNWNNDVGLVARSDIGGANGETYYYHANVCLTGGGGDYGETDTLLANDQDFSATHPPSEFYINSTGLEPGQGLATMVHEMGHQLGLGHSSYFNMMSARGSLPTSPVGPVPYPDDVAGVASLYGTKAVTNLFASGQRWDGSAIVNNQQYDSSVCTGNSFAATVTVANPGSQPATYSQQVLLATNADGSLPVVTFQWVGAVTPSTSFTTMSFAISTVGVSPGSYFLIHRVDTDNQWAELREDDNVLTYTGKVIVVDCNNTFAAFGSTALLFL